MAANLSELLRVLLSAVCKYRLTLKTWFSSSLLILLDYGSLPVFPNTFFVLVVRHIHWLKESAESFWVSLIVNMWLPFKWAYYLTRRIFFPFQGLSRKSQITHAVIDFWTGWFVPCIQLLPYRTINVSPIGCFALFRDLKTKWK